MKKRVKKQIFSPSRFFQIVASAACFTAMHSLAFGQNLSLTPEPSPGWNESERVKSTTTEAVEKNLNTLVNKTTEIIEFLPGSSVVGDTQMRSIRALNDSNGGAKAQEIIYIAAWSDRAQVRADKASDDKANIALAKDRITAIEQALKKLGVNSHVVTVNAESRYGTKLFSSKEEKIGLKMSQNVNSSDFALNEAGRLLHEKGGPQKGVIYIQR